ncbi:PAS domain-containing protein [Polyangium mundeleinium]|uniref:PAS domain-containing protein n=1 Tax=Polyangium mundeleinium TaxID=2995306 RepID=A0ABT5EYG6_9BACT|nr:PAS domain-containing protein [Polyangium mundeleinium]MDC0745856.1 PAS domain-containing protein [Polyangium mundeleinium]
MSHPGLEEECAALRAQVAELSARLAATAPAGDGPPREERAPDPEGELAVLRAAFRDLADAVIISDHEGRLVHCNDAATKMLGAGLAHLQPADWADTYHVFLPDGVTPFPSSEFPLQRALRGEITEGVGMLARSEALPEGVSLSVSGRPIRDKDGELLGAVVVFGDVGVRKRYEAERERRRNADAQRIAAEKDRLRLARILQGFLDNLDVVVWAIDDKGICTFHDGRGVESAGLTRGQLVGQNFFEIYSGDHLQRALAGNHVHVIDDGEGVIWEHWMVPVAEEDKRISGVIGMSVNVTEPHKAKLELEGKLALIQRQQEVILNLETPIIQVWDHVLTLPMVGVVDSRRAARVTDDLLAAVARTQSRFAILDLTGVEVVDTATAAHMLNILSAVRLLGAEGIITGIRPTVAQTMISLGLDLSRVRTLATLRDGLGFAIRQLGSKGARSPS